MPDSLVLYFNCLREHKVPCSYLQDYGEVPAYLQLRCEAERRAQEEYDKLVKEQREQEAMQQLSDEERQAVLEVLEHSSSSCLKKKKNSRVSTDTWNH